jgi:hypothetical protein
MRRHLPLILTFLAAGCAGVPPAPQAETPREASERRARAAPPTYNLTGYPPAVRDGYVDGCESAKRSQFGRKDAQRFAGDAQYQMGWNDGFGICGKK